MRGVIRRLRALSATRSGCARSLLLAVRANERAFAHRHGEYRISPPRCEQARRRRKLAGAGGPLGRGKRSAALGQGVLRGMRDIHVRPEGKDSTLLSEIDLLAGVSRGSFLAAHLSLYGEASFETFPDVFLYPDIEGYIWGTFLLHWKWDWVFNPLVGTNNRMTRLFCVGQSSSC
jgi:hypothetical protein